MKKRNFKSYITLAATALIAAITASCERGYSDEITLATYPATPEVFTDVPVGLTDAFFVSFDPADGANVYGFGTDDSEAYKGTSSIRIEVPAPNDPNGGFIGGIFLDRGNGRNLTEYDALTFWAKASTTASVGLFGFGTDFLGDKYAVGLTETTLSTDWKQYVIPIPDASKLLQEKGMFAFSAGTQSTNGLGYTFWLDEIRFQKLGTIAQPRPSIFGGQDIMKTSSKNSVLEVTGLTQTFNLADGSDITVNAAVSYFDYHSSDPFVAQVNEGGQISLVGKGTAKITATLNGVEAKGSLTIESGDPFELPPAPTQAASDVISIFSDAYTNVAVDFYNGYWQPYQTTTSADFDVNGDNILGYENFNFVGHQFSDPTVDATTMTHFHVDVYVPETLASGAQLKITIKDFGANNVDGGGDDTTQEFIVNASELAANAWSSIDTPLSLSSRSKVGQLIYENNDTDLTSIFLDNVYFYKQ